MGGRNFQFSATATDLRVQWRNATDLPIAYLKSKRSAATTRDAIEKTNAQTNKTYFYEVFTLLSEAETREKSETEEEKNI